MCKIDKLGGDYSCEIVLGFVEDATWYNVSTIYHESQQFVFIKTGIEDRIVAQYLAPKNLDPKLPVDVYTRLLLTSARDMVRDINTAKQSIESSGRAHG